MALPRDARHLDGYAARAKVHQIALASDLDLSALPEALRHQRVSIRPTPQLYVRTARFTYLGHEQLHAELAFDYDGARCDEQDAATRLPGRLPGTTVIRDQLAEDQARDRLKQLAFRTGGADQQPIPVLRDQLSPRSCGSGFSRELFPMPGPWACGPNRASRQASAASAAS